MKTYLGEFMNKAGEDPTTMSEKTKIPAKLIANYLAGKPTPSLENAAKMAEVLGITVDALITGEEKKVSFRDTCTDYMIDNPYQKVATFDESDVSLALSVMAFLKANNVKYKAYHKFARQKDQPNDHERAYKNIVFILYESENTLTYKQIKEIKKSRKNAKLAKPMLKGRSPYDLMTPLRIYKSSDVDHK